MSFVKTLRLISMDTSMPISYAGTSLDPSPTPLSQEKRVNSQPRSLNSRLGERDWCTDGVT